MSSGPLGSMHACATTASGAALCWGLNSSGQLGDGTTTGSGLDAVAVSGLGAGAVDAVAAGSYSCALTTAGGVKCWGKIQLNNASPPTYDFGPTPVDIGGLSGGATAITAAPDHACALLAGGAVKCWGLNHQGQLGDGTTTDSPANAVDVAAPAGLPGLLSGATAISTVVGQTLALTPDLPAPLPSAFTAVYWGGNAGTGCVTDCLGPLVPSITYPLTSLNLFGKPDAPVKLGNGHSNFLIVEWLNSYSAQFHVITAAGNVYSASAGGRSNLVFSLSGMPLG